MAPAQGQQGLPGKLVRGQDTVLELCQTPAPALTLTNLTSLFPGFVLLSEVQPVPALAVLQGDGREDEMRWWTQKTLTVICSSGPPAPPAGPRVQRSLPGASQAPRLR